MSYIALFPGQGSQYKGMCQALLERSNKAASIVRTASEVLSSDIFELLRTGSLQQLTTSRIAQPLVVAASVCYFQALLEQQKELPIAGIGHSLGELSSYICSEAISLEDGLLFAQERGELMERAISNHVGHAGLAIDIEQLRLEQIIGELQAAGNAIYISGYNSPNQFIVAGDRSSLKLLDQHIDKLDAQLVPFRMMPMKADAPYHSPLMSFIKQELQQLVQRLDIITPRFPTLSTVTQSIVNDPKQIRKALYEQLMTPVYWLQAIEHPIVKTSHILIDVGPNQIMHNLVQEHSYEKKCYAYDEMIG